MIIEKGKVMVFLGIALSLLGIYSLKSFVNAFLIGDVGNGFAALTFTFIALVSLYFLSDYVQCVGKEKE